ncbi:MAG: hypothetical protein ACRELB_21865, partial [Polyangiaceae bacterium]
MSRTTLWLSIGALLTVACADLWGFDDLTGDSGAPVDAGVDAGDSASSASDGGTDVIGDTATPTTYHDIANASFWSVFDTASLDPGAQVFFGGAFDGRYLYFVPSNQSGLAVRYDTNADFSVASSWETFSTGMLGSTTVGYRGGAFDGRYVYLVPFYDNAAGAGSGAVARFDTQAAFTNAASWTEFDTT